MWIEQSESDVSPVLESEDGRLARTCGGALSLSRRVEIEVGFGMFLNSVHTVDRLSFWTVSTASNSLSHIWNMVEDEGWWLSGCCGSVAKYWELKLTWVRFLTTGDFSLSSISPHNLTIVQHFPLMPVTLMSNRNNHLGVTGVEMSGLISHNTKLESHS